MAIPSAEAEAVSSGLSGLLRELRSDCGLSLSQAAMNAGVGKATLSRWEAGRAVPRLPELRGAGSAWR